MRGKIIDDKPIYIFSGLVITAGAFLLKNNPHSSKSLGVCLHSGRLQVVPRRSESMSEM